MIAPVFLDQAMHPDGGDLVDGDEHRLAALPRRGVVRDEVLGDGVEALGCGDDVVVAFQFAFEALFHVHVTGLELFELLRDPLVEVVRGDAELLASRVIVERHCGAVLHGALEPVPGDVVAEHPPGELVLLHQRSAGKRDVEGIGQGDALIERQPAVLGAVRLVHDDDDVVPLGVGLVGHDILVELLNQGEDVGLVLTEQPLEVPAVRGPYLLLLADDIAAGVGAVDLIVQIVAVAQHQEGEVAAQPTVHLAAEEHHGIGLAGPLRVPEDAEPAARALPFLHGAHRPVHAEVLLVLSDHLDQPLAAVVEQDEVLEQVEEVRLGAHPLEQRLHVHDAGVVLVEALPLAEVLEGRRVAANAGVHAVAEHHERVVMKDVGDGVLVVGEILVVGAPHVAVDVLQLHEQERDAVDETDKVGAAAVERPLDPQLAHREEVVVLGIVEVEDAQGARLHAAARVPVRDLHAVAQQIIFLLVGLQRGLCRAHLDDGADGVVDRFARQARIERIERLAKIAREEHLFLAGPAQRPVRPEGLGVVGVDRLPSEPRFEVLGRGLLDEGVFAVERRAHRVSVIDRDPRPLRPSRPPRRRPAHRAESSRRSRWRMCTSLSRALTGPSA